MREYMALVGHDFEGTTYKRIIEIHMCQNFIQAVETATLCIIDAGSYERILEVREVTDVESALISTTPTPATNPTF